MYEMKGKGVVPAIFIATSCAVISIRKGADRSLASLCGVKMPCKMPCGGNRLQEIIGKCLR